MLSCEFVLAVQMILLPSVSDHCMPIFATLLQLLSNKRLKLVTIRQLYGCTYRVHDMYYGSDSLKCCSVLS